MVATLVLVATGCAQRADYQLFVRNHSSEQWLIRTSVGDAGMQRVVLVRPGSEGLALNWVGAREKEIELLMLDCTVVGTFEFTVDDQVDVPGVAGVDGSVQPFGSNGDWNVSGIALTSACGGDLSM
ncbi:MAG TPA: hypothetical protein VIF08_07745 [Candidatus Limnocylindrales bacterium]